MPQWSTSGSLCPIAVRISSYSLFVRPVPSDFQEYANFFNAARLMTCRQGASDIHTLVTSQGFSATMDLCSTCRNIADIKLKKCSSHARAMAQ